MKENKEKTRGYIGRITNSGTQDVQAPGSGRRDRKGNVRITGTDLRSRGKRRK